MQFFVKTQVSDDKLDELTQKIMRKEIQPVKGNLVFLSPDGKIGYDIIEADSEQDARAIHPNLFRAMAAEGNKQ